MSKRCLPLFLVWLASVTLHAQTPVGGYTYYPIKGINSSALDLCIAMLPDSTMLISSYRDGTCKAYQMAWKDTSWVKIDSHLADMINSLMPRTEAEPHFRFSEDFTHIVVTIQEDGPHRYFESVKVNGEWSFFTPIEIDQKLEVWHALAMTSDHSKLYGKTKDGYIYQFNRLDNGWSQGTRF